MAGGTSELELLAADALRVGGDRFAGFRRADEDDRAAGLDELERLVACLSGSGGFDHDVGVVRVSGPRAERGRERVPRLAPADRGHVAARVRDAGTQHQPDRPGAEDGDEAARAHVRSLDRVQAARERIGECGDGRIEPARNGVEVDLGDAGRDEHPLGQCADELLGPPAQLLAAVDTGRTVTARRRCGGNDAPAVARVDAREFAAERRGRAVEGVCAERERTPLGTPGQSDLDLEHDLAVCRFGNRHLVDSQVARGEDANCAHSGYRMAVAIKLHRCSNIWVKVQGHPCWKVQSALDGAGIEYEVVKGPLFKSKRDDLQQLSGQRNYPVIEFEDGSAYREESKDMAAAIKAGKLDEKRGGATPPAENAPAG